MFLSADDNLLLKKHHATFASDVASTGYFSVIVLPIASNEHFACPLSVGISEQ